MKYSRACLSAFLMCCSLLAHADKITIAAASDLKFAMDEIVNRFQLANIYDQADVVYGSSGKFNTQIRQSAPFDLYFSSDIILPRALAINPELAAAGKYTLPGVLEAR